MSTAGLAGRRPLHCRPALLAALTLLVLLVLLVLLATRVRAGTPQPRLPTAPVTVVTADGQRHGFEVEVASQPSQRHQGLMFRWEVAEDSGMLFIFERQQHVSMWMRNTLIELTMLFIREDGSIARVVDRATPLSEVSIHSGEPVRAVLELAGGSASRLSIAAGDRIEHGGLFGTAH